jgi:hypothetical protein
MLRRFSVRIVAYFDSTSRPAYGQSRSSIKASPNLFRENGYINSFSVAICLSPYEKIAMSDSYIRL